ncbi:MAG TPA: tetratricopeptide repeat protein [Terracidiphilus sp.]|jgi:tetratricopeptide (TPR) repeat protein|nr:tetratricopeptide repeat protein [Terracidiphilus sp.]
MKWTQSTLGLNLLLLAVVLQTASAQTPRQDQFAQEAEAGQQAFAQGRFAEAQAIYEQLAKQQPAVAEIHATLAAICFQQRSYDEAVREIHTALKLKPTLPRLDNLLALSLAELDRFNEALPLLEKGFKQTADADTRRLCGLQLLRAYTGLNRDTDAVEVALQLNRLYPDDPEILYHTGRIYGNIAYVTMEKLHDKAANSVWMLEAQGDANEAQKDYDSAIIAFNHVLEVDPHRPGIHYRLGRIHLARFNATQKPDDREAALREFEAELEIDPSNGNARYEIAVLDANAGSLDDARAQFQQALAHFPDFEEALVGLAGVDLDQQKAADAVPLLERATKIRPDDEVAWYRLAQADRASGNRQGQQAAMAQFRKMHNSTPATLRKPNAEEVTPQQIGADAKP